MSVRFLPMRCTICCLKLSDTVFAFLMWFLLFVLICFVGFWMVGVMLWYVFLCFLVAPMLISAFVLYRVLRHVS